MGRKFFGNEELRNRTLELIPEEYRNQSASRDFPWHRTSSFYMSKYFLFNCWGEGLLVESLQVCLVIDTVPKSCDPIWYRETMKDIAFRLHIILRWMDCDFILDPDGISSYCKETYLLILKGIGKFLSNHISYIFWPEQWKWHFVL